jgi:hypothetical protein
MVLYIAELYIIYVWYIFKTSQVGKRISNPVAGGRRKQQDCRRDEEAARSREDARAAWIGTGREGGGSEDGGGEM